MIKYIIIAIVLMPFMSQSQVEFTTTVEEIQVINRTGPLNEMKLILPRNSGDSLYTKQGSYIKAVVERLHKDAVDNNEVDPIIQQDYTEAKKGQEKVLGTNFDGAGQNGVAPADPDIAVGPNHIVQMVNALGSTSGFGSTVSMFDKNGNSLITPFSFESISGTSGGGDPIVLFDQFANRWLLSEFNESGTTNALIFAISSGPNPVTSTWTSWAIPTSQFPDYPKWGLWRDSYIVSSNEGGNIGNYAIERADVLAGTSVTSVKLTFSNANGGFQAGAPLSVFGNTLPPAGEPAIILNLEDNAWSGVSTDAIAFWEFDVDWSNPGGATISKVQTLPVASFSSLFCGTGGGIFACLDQPSGTLIWAISHVIMNHAVYRNFGGYEAIACTHMVDVGSDRAGIRWYELRRDGGNWFIEQQSTYSPGSTLHRYHPGICMNSRGEIGLSYNVSSSTVFPGIRFTGRNYCDPYNSMTFAETVISNGTASGGARLGDYNVLVPDPADDDVYWTTAMYHTSGAWRTRIASFTIEKASGGGTVYVDVTAADHGNGTASNPFNSVVEAYQKFCDGFNVMMLESGTYIEAGLPQLFDSYQFLMNSKSGSTPAPSTVRD